MNAITNYLPVLHCLSFICYMGCTTWGLADTLPPRQYIGMAPVFNNNIESLKSFQLSGYVAGPIAFKFDVGMERPNRVAIRLFDHVDDTPYFVSSDENLLVYDAVHGRIVYGPITKGSWFIAKATPDQQGVQVRWGYTEGSADLIDIDIKSILPELHDIRAVSDSTHNVILTGTTVRGGTLKAFIDPQQKCPYTRVELLGKGAANPLICFCTIHRDTEIPAMFWTPVNKKLLVHELGARLMDWRDWGDVDMQNTVN